MIWGSLTVVEGESPTIMVGSMVQGKQVLEKNHGRRQMLGKHEAERQKLENEVSTKQWTAPKEQ